MWIKNNTSTDAARLKIMMLLSKSKPAHGILRKNLLKPKKWLFILNCQPHACSIMFTHPIFLLIPLSADAHKARRQSIPFPPSHQSIPAAHCHQQTHQLM